jgi:hypothetical protein
MKNFPTVQATIASLESRSERYYYGCEIDVLLAKLKNLDPQKKISKKINLEIEKTKTYHPEVSNSEEMCNLLERTCLFAERYSHGSEDLQKLQDYLYKFRNLPTESSLDLKEKKEILKLNYYVGAGAASSKAGHEMARGKQYGHGWLSQEDYLKDEWGGQGLHM